MNSIHERALRVIYQDNTSTFQEPLNKDKYVSIHHRNLQVLAMEMFKTHQGMTHSICHGNESFLDPQIWDLVPVESKQS